MLGLKKMNLLPLEYRSKALNRYIVISISAIIVVFVILIAGMVINMGILNMNINSLKKQNTEYATIKVEIEGLEKQITDNQSFINEQRKKLFDFYYFMDYLERCKPNGLTVISIDSLDRMSITNEESIEAALPDTESKQTEATKETEVIKQEEMKASGYEKDLSGERLVLRGLADNTQDISTYIYKLSQAPMIVNIELSGIEEQVFNQTKHINIFEAILEVK